MKNEILIIDGKNALVVPEILTTEEIESIDKKRKKK